MKSSTKKRLRFPSCKRFWKSIIKLICIFLLFSSEPFNVKNEKNLLLVSRYLIENNEEDHVILDFNRSCETLIIKSRFKKLIGNYALLNIDEEKSIYERISTVIFYLYNYIKLSKLLALPQIQTRFNRYS